MSTSRDLYAESEDLAAALAERGETEAAQRIRDAIAQGSTSSEILFALRWEFDRLLEPADGGDADIRMRTADLREAVERALA